MFKEYQDHESLITVSQCQQYDLMKLADTRHKLLENNLTDMQSLDQVIIDHYLDLKYLYNVLQSNITSLEQYPHLNQQQIFDLCFRSNLLKSMTQPVAEPSRMQRRTSIYERISKSFNQQKKAIEALEKICKEVSPNGLFLRYQMIALFLAIGFYL